MCADADHAEAAQVQQGAAHVGLSDSSDRRMHHISGSPPAGRRAADPGQREEALAAARRATELVPVSRDLVDGVLYTTVLARVHARLGEAAMTVKLLRELLQMPGGMFISVPMLKMDPQWDAIRADAAFQALYKD
ncbi:MAG: hypothetical protein WC000_02485 [Dokdonella sp.]